MANRKILLGLTTITEGDEWKNKVKEIDELGLKEIALFPTCLDSGQRQELYSLLEKTKLQAIPHVHLREEDVEGEELDYLVSRFKTQVFNIHPSLEAINFIDKNKKYKNSIFVENILMDNDNFAEVAAYCGGICLDLAHWESHAFIKKEEQYQILSGLLKKYKIGVNHLSAVKGEIVHYHDAIYDKDFYDYSDHNLADLSEVDYVLKHKNYLADIISLELENPLKRQLEVKKYLEKILL